MSWFFKENEHSKLYKKYRPDYPHTLFELIFENLENSTKKCYWDKCLDIGCGTGLSTIPLVSRFKEVIGIDASESQLKEATLSCAQYHNVFFKQANAENLDFIQNNSVDLIVIGQALHWFDIPSISKEFNRILKDNGLFIAYGYNISKLDNFEATNIFNNEFYKETLKGYFENGVQHIDDCYANIFIQLKNHFLNVCRNDALELLFDFTCEDFCGYLSTWSGYQKYRKLNPDKVDPLKDIYKRLKSIYGEKIIHCKSSLFILTVSKMCNIMATSNQLTNYGYLDNEFYLKSNCTFVNHGSYGAAPKKVLEYRIQLIREMEEQPDIWFREKLQNNIDHNISAISSFVGANPENIVFVANATTGLNCILRSLQFEEGDAILIHTWTYNAIKNLTFYVADQHNLKIVFAKMPFPLKSHDEIIYAYETALSANPHIKLVILDHISSMPPVLMPLERLIDLCRKYNKLIAVDGAHVPGQLPLNLEKLAPDFYTANLHKWLFAPRGCAILYVSPKYHSQILPTVISFFKRGSSLQDHFIYQGTNDITNFVATTKAIQFYQDAGGYEKITAYCHDLVLRAAKLLRLKWKVRFEDDQFPAELMAPHMLFLPLPILRHYALPSTDGERVSTTDIKGLMSDMWHKYGVQSIFISFEGMAWVRISANIYNKIEDYERLSDAILDINKE